MVEKGDGYIGRWVGNDGEFDKSGQKEEGGGFFEID